MSRNYDPRPPVFVVVRLGADGLRPGIATQPLCGRCEDRFVESYEPLPPELNWLATLVQRHTEAATRPYIAP